MKSGLKFPISLWIPGLKASDKESDLYQEKGRLSKRKEKKRKTQARH
jgi:hypothetical protein